jgi:hypothetical protein
MEGENKKAFVNDIAYQLNEKAEDFTDESADKIYNSEPDRKAGEPMEKAFEGSTIFSSLPTGRQAGQEPARLCQSGGEYPG